MTLSSRAIALFLTGILCTNVAYGFVTPLSSIPARSLGLSSLKASAEAEAAIWALASSNYESVNKIAASIPDLQSKPELSWDPDSGVSVAGLQTALDGRDAVGQSNVAWLSSLYVASKISSLTIFNGPLTDVPHLHSKVYVDASENLVLELDFRPRGYGAYEMVDASGNYPGPEQLGREAFTYSGNRKEFDTKFGTEEVKAFFEATKASLQGATAPTEPVSELDKLVRGPLYLSVIMPNNQENVNAVVAAREKAVDYWLSWATDDSHGHKPGAPINAQFVYDSKYRQNSYGTLLPVYTNLFGLDVGVKVTAADSGPLDEAYVGGGS